MRPQPDYRRLLKVIAHEEPDRVPLAELGVDTALKDKFMRRPVRTLEDHLAFQLDAGMDFIYLRANYEYDGCSPVVASGTPIAWEHSISPEQETVGTYQPGPLRTFADMESYPWPDPETVDVSHIQRAFELAPAGLGIITGVGGIFTRTWMLMGYEHFSTSLIDEPELVARIARCVGSIQVAVLRRLLKLPGIVAVWYGDDLGYTESLLTSPKVLRRHFFPWIEELAGLAHGASMPFIMHSDGRLVQVLDDLVSLGLNALHPIEPKAMDIYELRAKYGKKLALFGNIDLGYTLTEGTGNPAAVRAEVREKIKRLASGGGYGVASGAGATRYVALENFNAMREATFEYGTYPISL